MRRELGRLMVAVATPTELIPAPGTSHRRPVHGRDLELEEPERSLRIGEILAKRMWGHRKLGNIRPGSDPPDLVATDLRTGVAVSIELTGLAYTQSEIEQDKVRRFKHALYTSIRAQRPKFRGTAVVLYYRQGKCPPARGKTAQKVLSELMAWMTHDARFGGPTPIDQTSHPTLWRYIREGYLQPTSEEDYRHAPDDPLVVLTSSGAQRIYAEGDLPILMRQAIERKLAKEYSFDMLVLHNWVDPFILSSAPESAAHSLAVGESGARRRGISDAVLSLGRAVARETQVSRRFGETWLVDVGLHEDLRRLDP